MEISMKEARAKFADTLSRVAYSGERIIVKRYGKGVVALVPIEDLELLEALETKADIRAALKARKEKGGISLEEYRKKRGI